MPKLTKAELIKSRFEIARRATKRKFQLFNECDEIYHGVGKTQVTNAQIHNPYSWANVETVVPRMVARRPTVLYMPREDGDTERADNLQALYEYWWEKDQAFTKVVSWVKDALIYGTGIVKVYWKTRTKRVTRYVYDAEGFPAVGEDGQFMTEEIEVKDFDDPCMENVNLYNFFVDPQATSLDDAAWVIHRYWKTLPELEEAGYYKNLNKLKNLEETRVDRTEEDQRRHEVAYGDQHTEDDTVGKIECLEMWDNVAKTYCVLAGGEVIIREQAFPFWHGKLPFIRLVDSLVPQEFYGKGEIEPVKKLQYALDTIQNQLIDYKTAALQPMWKVRGDVDESELVFRPNGAIHTSEFDDADPVTLPDITGMGVQEMANIKADIQQALGIYDYTKGSESGVNKTATGVSLIQEAANARFAHKIQLLEEALKELGEMVAALYQQFITDEKEIRVVGDKSQAVIRLLPQDVAGNYDVDVEAGSTRPVDKETDRQEALSLLQVFSGEPDPEFQFALKKNVLETFGKDDLVEALTAAFQAQMEAMAQEQLAAEHQAAAEASMSGETVPAPAAL